MPLEKVPTPQFLFRRRVFIDPYSDTIDPNAPMHDMTVRVPYHPGKVTSIEITDFLIPRDYTPPVLVQAGRKGINTWVDLRVTTYPVATATLDISFEVNATRDYFVQFLGGGILADERFRTANGTIPTFVDSLATALDIEMDRLGDATFSTSNGWNFVVTEGQVFPSGRYGNIHIELRDTNVANTATVQFLGATGANAGSQAFKVFGFEEGFDTPATQTINGTLYTALIPERYINLFPYRYIDVSFDEIPELQPHTRFWNTSSLDYKRNEWAVEKPRLLTDPPRRIERLTSRLRVQNGLLPNEITFKSWNFTFDIIQVSPETEVPPWVEQFLTF